MTESMRIKNKDVQWFKQGTHSDIEKSISTQNKEIQQLQQRIRKIAYENQFEFILR